MSYATEILKDTVKSHVMIRIKPRILVTGFAVHSGNVYVASLNVDYVLSVGDATTAKTSAAACTANTDFYYDSVNDLLYMYSSTAVVGADEFVATFEMYFSTFACLWHRIPTDTTTDTVEWVPNIASAPDITSSLGDQAFGINIIDASGFSVFFDPEKHQHLVSEASFKNVEVWVYHVVGRLTAANIDALFYGLLDDKISVDFEKISFGLTQKSFAIDGALSTVTITTTPGPVDPSALYQSARAVRGSVGDVTLEDDSTTSFTAIKGFLPVNRDFDDSTPTTSDNRQWLLAYDKAWQGIPASGSPSGGTPGLLNQFEGGLNVGYHSGGANSGAHVGDHTWKAENSVGGVYPEAFSRFNIGDRVRVRNLTSVTNYYVKIVDKLAGSPAELQFDANVGTGDVLVTKYATGAVYLVQNSVYYELMPVRDYYVSYPASVSLGASLFLWLTSSAEANVGASTIDPSNGDYIVCTIRAEGLQEAFRVTFDGGSNWTYLNGIAGRILTYLAHDMRLAWETVGGVTSELDHADVFDLQSFVDFAASAVSDPYDDGGTYVSDDSWFTLGLLPNSQGDSPPNHIDVLAKMLEAGRAVLFYSPDELIKIKSLDVATSVGTIELEDVIAKSLRIEYDFRDVDNVIYDDFVSEVGLLGSSTAFYEHRPYVVSNANDPDDGGSNTTLHGTTNARKVSSKPLTLRPTRKGTLTLKTSLRLVASDVGSTVTLRSKYLPGFEYDGETIHEADYVITEIQKGVDGVTITLDV